MGRLCSPRFREIHAISRGASARCELNLIHMRNEQTNCTIILPTTVLVALILANFYFIQNFWLGLTVGTIFLIRQGIRTGKLILPQFNAYFQAVLGGLAFVAANSIILWIGFYLYQVNNLLVFGSLIITATAIELLIYKFNRETYHFNWPRFKQTIQSIAPKSLIAIYFILVGACFYYLAKHGTTDAIASPWLIVSKNFWLTFTAATLALIALCFHGANKKLSVFCVSIHAFLLAGLGFFIYKLGFGYDPFIHFAAMREIIDKGTLLPKTPYYIGGHTTIIFLVKLLGLSLDFVNRALLPFLFALTAPITIYTSLRKRFDSDKRSTAIALFALFLLPLTFFINTTPQGLTNLLCVLIIFLSLLLQNKKISTWFLLFLSFYAFTIHPLYGAPIIIFTLLTIIIHRVKRLKTKIPLLSIGTILLGACIPLLFIANSMISGLSVSFSWPSKLTFLNATTGQTGRQFNFLFDTLYAYGSNARFIFAALAFIGLILLIRRKQFKPFIIPACSAAAMLVSYFITKNFLHFGFATDSNKDDYLLRLSELACYFALPIAAYLLYEAVNNARKSLTAKTFIVVMLTMLVGSCFYFTYPTKDNYSHTHSFNVSQADIDTVHFIQENARGDYIVLGNQMLAAATIREFGFANYYNGNFYYSIPEAGKNKIYPYFEKMALEKPLRVHAEDAMKVAGVSQAYFVVPEYWSGAKKIIEEAKKTANTDWPINMGKTNVFFYTQK